MRRRGARVDGRKLWSRLGALFVVGVSIGLGCSPASPPAPRPLNLLLIVGDDLDLESIGAFGSPTPGTTPHIDRLAAQGMRFERAHVTSSICMPSRAVWMTARYPHRSGALGFERIDPGVPTLVEALREAGFYTGILGKLDHVVPSRRDAWDETVSESNLGEGRSPDLFQRYTEAFLGRAREAGRPFFLMANLHDAHRPFPDSRAEAAARRRLRQEYPPPPRRYGPEQVVVPPFLPDLPGVRREFAQYLSGVTRADAVVGAVTRALDEAGFADDTLVMFLSDNGVAFPFAKANCWQASTRTPWIVRWPGVTAPGSRDATHLVSGIDLAPTLLEAAGLEPLPGSDGRSFAPLLRGEPQEGRDRVFTQIDRLKKGDAYPMRAVSDGRFGYIVNPWSDGVTEFESNSQRGLTMAAMKDASRDDAGMRARVDHFLRRTPEELYDYERDPGALHNLVGDDRYAKDRARLRADLLAQMERSGDPQLPEVRRVLGLQP